MRASRIATAEKYTMPKTAMPTPLTPPKRRKPVAAKAKPCVLLTGFDAFGDDRYCHPPLNPSWLAAEVLHGEEIAGHRIVGVQLPCMFDASLTKLQEQLLLNQPALVICLGQAGGRSAISLERVAININDARMADNAGMQPVDTPVVTGGPSAYFSTLPIKAMLLALQQSGAPAEVSQTAGTFVCNHVFYGLMHLLATDAALAGTRGGFVHVPYLPEQVRDACTPSLVLPALVAALRVAVATACLQQTDIELAAGALD
jgi:pyroglutamyl-peptidase